MRTSPGAMRLAVDQVPARHDADDEPRDIVLAVGVEARHLGGLAAEQRAAVGAARAGQPLDNLHGDVRIQPPGGQIVEEEERVGTLHEDVVDAVVDEVDADRRVHAGHERDPQLGPDAVGARDEHRIVAARVTEPEEPAERPDLGQHPRRERAARERPNPPNDLVAGVDVDAGLLVVHARLCSNGCLASTRFSVDAQASQNSSLRTNVSATVRAGDPAGAAQ